MIANREQQAAIDSDADVTVVAAGPGSGKSATLVQTVRAHVAAGANPKRIVCLTFTNAGAHVYVERLKPLVLGFAGTVHGYGIRLLQAFGAELGYRAGSISIVTKETQEAMLLATACKLLGRKSDGKPKISKTELMDNATPNAQLVWRDYRHDLKTSNMIDFDMILVESLRLLKLRGDGFLEVDELFVDECQDSGDIDWAIYRAIDAKRMFLVGDPDQSIYGFRGGRPELLVQASWKSDVKLVTLYHNYRSDMTICRAATMLIAHNPNRIPKSVTAMSKDKGHVQVIEVEHAGAEAFKAYQCIRESGYGFGECAILCRTNAIATAMATTLRGFGVAVKRTGGMRLPEDWSTALSAIGLLIDPNNNHHAEQLLLKYKSLGNIEQLKLKALRESKSLATVALLPNVSPASLSDALTMLFVLGVSAESMELVQKRVAVLPNPNPTLSDLLADLWNNDKWNVENEGDGITVCTIHAAKGKEWDFVLVPACEEGILPHGPKLKPLTGAGAQPSDTVDFKAQENLRIETSDIEEERRLFFVAITRARHQLVLTHARQRTAFYKTTTQEPSRFLTEIKTNAL